MGKRIVVALGGNALGNTPLEQLEKVKIAADIISDLVKDGSNFVAIPTSPPGPISSICSPFDSKPIISDFKVILLPLLFIPGLISTVSPSLKVP